MAARTRGGRKHGPVHGHIRDGAAERRNAGILPHAPGPQRETPLADMRDQSARRRIRDCIEIQLTRTPAFRRQIVHYRLKIMFEQFGHRRGAGFLIRIAGCEPDRGKADIRGQRKGQVQREKVPRNPCLAPGDQIDAGKPASRRGEIQRYR